MKVIINKEWLEENVYNHSLNGKLWKEVIEEHDRTGEYQFDVTIKGGGRYGVRVGFFDKRLYRNKLYVTPTEGNYKLLKK